MKSIFFCLLLALPFGVIARNDCWLVGQLKGMAIREGDSEISKDAMSGMTFKVGIYGKLASVEPSDLTCTPMGEAMLVCAFVTETRATVETWAIDTVSGRVVHTSNRSLSGPFTGGRLFVGKVLGLCGPP